VLHNSVDLDRYASGRSIRETFGFPADAIIVATIGQISRRKGVDVFLDMAARLRSTGLPLRFLVVGPPARDEDAYVQQIERRLRDEFAGEVRYVGSRRDIPDILASIDVFCFPTRAEPFGMVIVEAMAAGVPVVVSRVGGVPEILTDPSLGTMVDPPDAEGFARAIEDLARRGAAAMTALGARGRASLPGRFDTPSMTARLTAIYDGLFDGGAGQPGASASARR
jgi:glycosyltransferase involved in cell wall biosynthesis